jgi:flavorubredoxin
MATVENAAGPARVVGSGIVEIGDGSLAAVSACVELDGRLSWVPAATRGFHPMHCYVLTEGENVVIVDPGPPATGDVVISGVRRLVARDTPVDVFLTRYQYDGIGNLGRLADIVKLERIYSGGVANPFDSFDQITAGDMAERLSGLQLERLAGGSVEQLGPARNLEIIAPVLRTLSTFWGYDTGTKTLLTSDTFSHGIVSAEGGRPVIDDLATDGTTVDHVRENLLATFSWLRRASVAPIIESLRRIFDEHQVDVIAPSRGCILQGADVVAHHLDLVTDAIATIGDQS